MDVILGLKLIHVLVNGVPAGNSPKYSAASRLMCIYISWNVICYTTGHEYRHEYNRYLTSQTSLSTSLRHKRQVFVT